MKRSGRSRKKQSSEIGSQLRTIPQEQLEQQRVNRPIERTPISRQLGSSVPVSQLLSQQMSSQVDDEDGQPNDRIFINHEEQRRFRALLELFRKGKITQHNAFEVPVRVLQPEEMEASNLHMWRVASDMLNVSTSIYEKRVENTYQESSKVHMGINRSEEPNSTDSKKREEPKLADRLNSLFSKGLAEVERGMLQKIDVGKGTLEEPDRLDSNPDEQFCIDPFFQKTRSTFDSSTAKGLLLNCFELAASLEIRLIAEAPKEEKKLNRSLSFPQNFEEAANIIDPSESQIFRIFTQTQEELCRGFQACGLEEQQNSKKVIVRLEAEEISKICEDIDEVSQIDPSSQPALYPGEYHDEPQPVDNIDSAQSLPEKSVQSLNESRIVEILSEYDALSEREHVVGTGRTDYLENFNSPWDIPNPFSKKRKPPARLKASKKEEIKDEKKAALKLKELINFDPRQKIDKGFLKSKSKNRSDRTLRTLEELDQIKPQFLIPLMYREEDTLQISLKPPIIKKVRPVSTGLAAPKSQKMEQDGSSTNQDQFTFALDHRDVEENVVNLELGPINQRQDEQDFPREPQVPLNIGSLLSGVPSASRNYENILNLQPVASQNRQISMKKYKTQLFNNLAELDKCTLTTLPHEGGISVQTTFVALLHLANQKGFSFEPSLQNDDFSIVQPKRLQMEHD